MKRGESETLYQKKLWEIAEESVPQKECGIYTQSLMDLGSMVCRRSGRTATAARCGMAAKDLLPEILPRSRA